MASDMRQIKTHGALRAVAYDSVAEIRASEWDALTSGAFYPSHSWSTYQERDQRSQSWAVAIFDDASLVAASTVHRVSDERSASYDLNKLLGCQSDANVTLLCGNRRGHDNRLLAAPDRDDAVALLVESLALEAERVGAEFAWWPYLDDRSLRRLLPYAPVDEPWLLQLTAEFDLPPGGFEEFLFTLTKQQRGKIRRDRRQFAASSRRIQRGIPPADSLDRVSELVTNVETKHGSDTGPEVIRELLEAQVADVGERASLITCTDEVGPIACTLTYQGTTELAVRVAGLDYAEVGDAAEYFETVYYQPIELAYECGLETVSLGFGSLQAKRHRGASVNPRWALPLLEPSKFCPVAPRVHNEMTLAHIESTERIARESSDSVFLKSFQ